MHGATIGSSSTVTIAPDEATHTITVTAGAATQVGLSRLTLEEAYELAKALVALVEYQADKRDYVDDAATQAELGVWRDNGVQGADKLSPATAEASPASPVAPGDPATPEAPPAKEPPIAAE